MEAAFRALPVGQYRYRQRCDDATGAGHARGARARVARHGHAGGARRRHSPTWRRWIACVVDRGSDTLVAVGSGTINDLCKYVAALDGKPYVVFATAPSMNGYTYERGDHRGRPQEDTARPGAARRIHRPYVFAAAPLRMIQAGLGDSLCRSTAQADWSLARHLFDAPYREAPFALLAADESALLDAPEALVGGDLDAMRVLARTLVLSGLGMTICGGSHPASQGEHLISHYIDMFAPRERAAFFHGEQVAVATLTMAQIQEAMLAARRARRRCVDDPRNAVAAVWRRIGEAC
jgi:glycerol-1-phosphate dehydrogenase [NAD(P)+]